MKFVKYLFILVVACILLGAASIYGLYRYIEPQLPDVATLKDIRLQTPMQVFSAEGELIAQFGEKRRIPLRLDQIPPELVHAFIATEDSRFYDHHGIDPVGIIRAASIAMMSGHASQGASTITQQLARNFFLSPERTLIRKIKEVFLAVRIEQLLSKDEILELYLNKIYLGYRAYGVGAAAHVYFGKSVDQLTLSEMAMIAGLPKAPSTFNPLYSYDRALSRRNVVLARMRDENYITQAQYDQARNEKLEADYHTPEIAFSAPWLAEMVRQEMFNRYGENAYNDGYKVYTTVTRKLQLAAQDALRNNVLAYDMRHGYRGPEKVLWRVGEAAWDRSRIIDTLKKLPVYGPLMPAVVTLADADQATAQLADGSSIQLPMEGIRWARAYKSDMLQGAMPRRATDAVQAGQQIWVRQVGNVWWLAQVPDVNSALVSLNPSDGAVRALVGGFDFNLSKFNRATQALRQVGSNIKPFLYTAAMDKGLTLASILNDVPIARWDAGAGSDWRPKNSPAEYDGPIRLRQGLGQSKNVVMVRAMRAMGVDYAAEYLQQRFGFPAQNIVHSESLALGSASFTPLQLVRGYAVMVNGGYLVDPYFITKIENDTGEAVFTATPKVVCNNCNLPVVYGESQRSLVLSDDNTENVATSRETPQPGVVPEPRIEPVTPAQAQQSDSQPYAPHVISTPLSFLIKDALNSNVFGEPGWMGTGWRAGKVLQRRDIGGKTGTTNSSKDAWFSGYGPDIVTSVWIGFDDHRRALGRTTVSGALKDQISGYEGGAKSAQPAWDDFMKVALEGVPEQKLTPPPGIVSVTIDRSTGKLSGGGGNSRSEYFIDGTQPTEYSVHEAGTTLMDNGESQELF
ncbi:peptidoglycan glycosyltransferase/peptidoglycan DD-transpeptidase MrcA [Affinibrenneria salicis]|uniref:Penicillin-binding protein 1A n=1 Tax=Affinibrenneria salicis TaxID=2590031 RepID=A0A5J5FT13_9GAMM|nr:peptidoglycan glycosyltransferase/peptidoglycan DD-transpeptidase MrcA [Affinibrenneria salicis]KAA8996375.1 peptidoglycan glycosyltransferase/peptidoglycan DD-transpeptidase MrcA [Affinibrenneria salicis]